MSKWIRVNDEMPKYGQTVVVGFANALEEFNIEKFDIDYVEVCADTCTLYFADNGSRVTHWMAIPGPAQGGGEDE